MRIRLWRETCICQYGVQSIELGTYSETSEQFTGLFNFYFPYYEINLKILMEYCSVKMRRDRRALRTEQINPQNVYMTIVIRCMEKMMMQIRTNNVSVASVIFPLVEKKKSDHFGQFINTFIHLLCVPNFGRQWCMHTWFLFIR